MYYSPLEDFSKLDEEIQKLIDGKRKQREELEMKHQLEVDKKLLELKNNTNNDYIGLAGGIQGGRLNLVRPSIRKRTFALQDDMQTVIKTKSSSPFEAVGTVKQQRSNASIVAGTNGSNSNITTSVPMKRSRVAKESMFLKLHIEMEMQLQSLYENS